MISPPEKSILTFEAAQDMVSMVIGNKIGSGGFREVYEYLPNDDYVIKVANGCGGIEHNFREHLTYTSIYHPFRDYFAEVYDISNNGHFIRQRKVALLDPLRDYDCILPYIEDVHYWNVGALGGKVVIFDLGFPFIREMKLKHAKIEAASKSVIWGDDYVADESLHSLNSSTE